MGAKSQRVIITVGRVQIMLPDDVGAAQVLKTLSRGMVVWHFGEEKVMLRKEEMEVSLTYLKSSTQFEDEDHNPVKAEPVMDKKKLLAAKSGVLELPWKGGRGS